MYQVEIYTDPTVKISWVHRQDCIPLFWTLGQQPSRDTRQTMIFFLLGRRTKRGNQLKTEKDVYRIRLFPINICNFLHKLTDLYTPVQKETMVLTMGVDHGSTMVPSWSNHGQHVPSNDFPGPYLQDPHPGSHYAPVY